jgi:hypothetical protein
VAAVSSRFGASSGSSISASIVNPNASYLGTWDRPACSPHSRPRAQIDARAPHLRCGADAGVTSCGRAHSISDSLRSTAERKCRRRGASASVRGTTDFVRRNSARSAVRVPARRPPQALAIQLVMTARRLTDRQGEREVRNRRRRLGVTRSRSRGACPRPKTAPPSAAEGCRIARALGSDT